MSSDKVVQGSTSPSRKQTALSLACAILSNPNITEYSDPLTAADEALRLLGYLEQKLRVVPTFRPPAD